MKNVLEAKLLFSVLSKNVCLKTLPFSRWVFSDINNGKLMFLIIQILN